LKRRREQPSGSGEAGQIVPRRTLGAGSAVNPGFMESQINDQFSVHQFKLDVVLPVHSGNIPDRPAESRHRYGSILGQNLICNRTVNRWAYAGPFRGSGRVSSICDDRSRGLTDRAGYDRNHQSRSRGNFTLTQA
jgi:hypothetical protein